IPEEDDTLEQSVESPTTLNPPARLASRFYHSSSARRKSSAASSRRNSISSTHSHQSNRSYRGTNCQSNHVAQHLRRASIIESRKARLADRAAHAEQVRLRAALAKAATRASNSEERALAAQHAREKHLAQVAAACAEEVKRAKKVAEEMKERKAAEEQRYRLEMEEKHAEAERRRAEYKKNMRRPRTASVPATDAKKELASGTQSPKRLSDLTAAATIQEAWRRNRRRRALEAFVGLGLTVEKSQEASFDDISTVLADDKVVNNTIRVLEIFNLDAADDKTTVPTRTFLSAYLILGHPASVLSRDGAQEQDLINKAKDLMICFEAAVLKAMESSRYMPTPTQLEHLSFAFTAYRQSFGDWKARDSSALIEAMVASFVNLDAIWQSVKDYTDGEVAADYREGIRENQVILLSKIRKLAGPDKTHNLIKRAIRESRRARPRPKPLGDTRPRVDVDTEAESSREQATPSHSPEATHLISASGAETHDELQPSNSFGNLFSLLPTNRKLVHELAINKEYRIEPSPQSDFRHVFSRQLCDDMKRGFEQGEGNLWTVSMAENIRGKLLRLLREGNSMYNLISEALDPSWVESQCNAGNFSYEKFFKFMADILPRLCAPFRDGEVKELVNELLAPGDLGEMIEKVFKLLRTIDLLSLDHANFMLTTAVPSLIAESAGYEQRMFRQDLESGKVTLAQTKRWWHNASVNLFTEFDRRDPDAVGGPNNRPTMQRIYARGLVDLSVAVPSLRGDELPETLSFDQDRIVRIRADTVRITTIGAMLLTAKNLLKRDVRSQWRPEANRIWDLLKNSGHTSMTVSSSLPSPPPSPSSSAAPSALANSILQILTSAHPMPTSSQSTLLATVTRHLTQAASGRLTDPVLKVLFSRLRAHIFARVAASSSGERVRRAATAGEGLSSSGLGEFVERVEGLVEELGRVTKVDWAGHAEWYEQLVREVEEGAERE
ncbi:hypothetical protein P152DRAFT_376455, partial [Eremomyces bilateralis CBS 781.70]